MVQLAKMLITGVNHCPPAEPILLIVHVAPFISSAVNLPSRAVVKHADRKSIFQISDEINELAVKARDGKLTADEILLGD
jgi:hypothetical protein